jgi:sec-independent protein translocase protein TatB
MFDVGFSEMMLIGLIALLVLGPERLPPLVRGVGRWMGRAQRMVRDFRTQLENETSVRDLRTLQGELNKPLEQRTGLTAETPPPVDKV